MKELAVMMVLLSCIHDGDHISTWLEPVGVNPNIDAQHSCLRTAAINPTSKQLNAIQPYNYYNICT